MGYSGPMRVALACSILVQLLPLPAGAQPERSKILECRRDEDCGFAISVCGECAPCQPGWRPTANRAEIRRIQEIQARARCTMKQCPTCERRSGWVGWVGHHVICRAQRCTPAQRASTAGSDRATEIACKRDEDCVVGPRSGCGCPLCGVQVTDVVSKQHAESLQREYAKESCARPQCAACAVPPTWLPGKPACHAGRCLLVPPAVK
jgi:hypothetical protein